MALANEKPEQETQNPVRRALENNLLTPLRESRSEMRKVIWPSREETTRLTIVVVILSAVLSLLLFGADSLFTWLIFLLQGAVTR